MISKMKKNKNKKKTIPLQILKNEKAIATLFKTIM